MGNDLILLCFYCEVYQEILIFVRLCEEYVMCIQTEMVPMQTPDTLDILLRLLQCDFYDGPTD